MSTDTPPAPSPRAFPVSPLLASAVILAVAAGLVLGGAALLRPRSEPLPQLGTLPDFTFTRQDGQPFGRAQLQGRPFVANFIFTRCPTVCPVFTRKMAQLQKRTAHLGTGLALVSFSVDPRYDTPERLTAYAAKHGADPARWSFLTGDYTQLQETVVGGFKIAMGREGADENDIPSIFHGSHFVLVDGQGQIRGYYNGEDDEALGNLDRDVERLVGEGR